MILVTDPAYVRDPSEYQINVIDREGDEQSRLFVKLNVTDSLFNQIGALKSHSVASRESDESFYQFGSIKNSLNDYEYVGWHLSDSGMTCIVKEDPFSFSEEQYLIPPVDMTEFTLATIEDPEMESNLEEFPLYNWFGRIPEAASSVRVYGCDRDEMGKFNGLLLRSGEDNLIDNEEEDEQHDK